MIKSYYQFLLESILFTSQYFEDILKDINDDISKDLLSFINKDIKTQYNAINITDTNDRLSFVSDNQFQNKLKQGINPLDLFKDENNKTNITRIVRQILKDNGKEYSDSDLTKFVDRFKASYNNYKAKSEKREPIRVVSGEDIRHWYLIDNYCEKTKKGFGTLGKSCMRYEECQPYFDIYVESPSVCKLIILTEIEDGEEVLKARALLWTTDKGLFLDRIYFTEPSESEMITNFAKDKLGVELNTSKYIGRVKVDLEPQGKHYKFYPYMDNLPYYYTISGTLYSYEPDVNDRKELLYCQDTGGGFDRQDLVYCEYLDDSFPEDQVIWSEYHQSNIPIDRSCWSDYYNSELYDSDSVYSETLEDNLPKDDSIKAYIDSRNEDWFPKEHDLIACDNYDGEWYLRKLMRETIDGNIYNKEHVIEIYQVRKSDIQKYKEIFSIDEDVDEDDCIMSINIMRFYGLNMKDDSTGFIFFEDYYKKVYMNIHFVEMYQSLDESENADDIIDELESANFRLKDKNNFYTNNNIILDNGGLENAISLFNKYLDVKLKGKESTVFNNSFIMAKNVLRDHVQSGLLKEQIRKIFQNSLIEFCQGVSDYNTKYPKFDKNKLSNIIKMFELVFPEYNDVDEIDYYLGMTAATLEYCFRGIYSNLTERENSVIQSLRYFTYRPNKLPVE